MLPPLPLSQVTRLHMNQAEVSGSLCVEFHDSNGGEEAYASEYPKMNQSSVHDATKFDVAMATPVMYSDQGNDNACLDGYQYAGMMAEIQPVEEVGFGSNQHFKGVVADSEDENLSSSPATSSTSNHDTHGYMDQLQNIYNALDEIKMGNDMEAEEERGGDESAALSVPISGKKSPPSPSTLPIDGEDSPCDEEEDEWVLSDDEEDAEELYEWEYRPFTVDDFPRVSDDHEEQTLALYRNPDIQVRGPLGLRRLSPYNAAEDGDDFIYQLHNTSEINVSNVRAFDCSMWCRCSYMTLLQFIDIKISGYRAKSGHSKVFGFFATRDYVEPLRNYVYRREIDSCEDVTVTPKTGIARLSLSGPARGICTTSHILFEFELCTRTEDPTEGGSKSDILIDGCAEFHSMFETDSFTQHRRLYGEKCGLDLKFLVLVNAIQAFVDLEVLRAPSCGLDLNFLAKTSGFEDVIRLYKGTVHTGYKMSAVVAVEMRNYLDLRIDANPKVDGFWQELSCYKWVHTFNAYIHGILEEELNPDPSTKISVKVIWKSVK